MCYHSSCALIEAKNCSWCSKHFVRLTFSLAASLSKILNPRFKKYWIYSDEHMNMSSSFFIGKNEYPFGLNCFYHWYNSFLPMVFHIVCRKLASHLMFYCICPATLQTMYGVLPGLIFNHIFKNSTNQKSMSVKISG